ncbi:MAG: transketolase-like TK C-terminal-containing protein, partial [Campylobacter sp.]
RQGLEPLPKAVLGDVQNGAYLLRQSKEPQITLIASGSEVSLCLKAAAILQEQGIGANVVSAPCFELLCEQDADYLAQILQAQTKILAVEAASALEWYKFADAVHGMRSFGESGNASELFKLFGFTDVAIAKQAKELLEQ